MRGFNSGDEDEYFKVCEHVTMTGFKEAEEGSGDISNPVSIICSQCKRAYKLSHEDYY